VIAKDPLNPEIVLHPKEKSPYHLPGVKKDPNQEEREGTLRVMVLI